MLIDQDTTIKTDTLADIIIATDSGYSKLISSITHSDKAMAKSSMLQIDKKNTALGVIQKCQHFHECKNSTPFHTPPLQVYRPTILVSKIWVSRIIFIVQQQKLTLLSSLFDM